VERILRNNDWHSPHPSITRWRGRNTVQTLQTGSKLAPTLGSCRLANANMISNRRDLFPQARLVQERVGDASAARVSSEAQPSGLSPAGDCAKLTMRRVPARRRLGGACLAVRIPVAMERGPGDRHGIGIEGPAALFDHYRRGEACDAVGPRYSRNRLGARPEKTREGALQRVESPFVMQNIAINYETKSFGRGAPREVPAAT
jgi:hypothetical protein